MLSITLGYRLLIKRLLVLLITKSLVGDFIFAENNSVSGFTWKSVLMASMPIFRK